MIERQFFIYPLSEDEIKNLKAKHTGSIATEYQQPPAAEEQPKGNTIRERRIFTIYEAPKTEVATQQNQAPEIIPTSEIIPGADPQLEIYTATTEKQDALTTIYNRQKSSRELLTAIYGEPKPYTEILTAIYGEPKPYTELLTAIYGEKSPTEENQLASVRNQLQEITSAPGAPAPQGGELAQAA